MHNRIDTPEGVARRANKLSRRSGRCEVAGVARDPGAGTLALRDDRVQSLEPRRIGPLSMQHQALIPPRQPARDRGSDPGSAAGDD
jgi:hypothetical protein